MALPTMTDEQINGNALGSGVTRLDITYTTTSPAGVSIQMFPAQTAFATTNATNSSATTANLATDTIIYRPDGGIWDDTVQAWISVDKTNIIGTPRKHGQ
jgi:hypothetical protein